MLEFNCEFIRNFKSYLNSIDEKTRYKAMAAIATPIAIVAGSYMVYRCLRHAYKCKEECVFTRSMSVGALHGGKLALERLIDYHHARTDAASLNAAETDLKALLAEEQPDFNKLQSTVSKLEMSGKEVAAVEILERGLEKARKEKKCHEAYEIEMLLVEMLIYKGAYEKALNSECLNHLEISDARRPLYMAIIHIMLDHPKDEALKCWEEFTEVREHFQSPPSTQEDQLCKAITDFQQFHKVVRLLKKDINKAHSTRRSLSK